MNRRNALLSCGLFLPFFQTLQWLENKDRYSISFSLESGILIITSKTSNISKPRIVKVNIEEIMDALESK